jgi:catechol 2,3-dioxygenase-like lactoylglutathione lyase family enzyme
VNAPLLPIPVLQLDHLNLTVRDLKSSLAFYRDLFGFELVEQGNEEDAYPWVIVRSGSAMLCLYEHSDLPTAPRFPRAPVCQEVRHFALRIQDGPAFRRLCEARRVPLLYDGPVSWPHSTSYYIEDQTGHQIEVVAWDDDRIEFG